MLEFGSTGRHVRTNVEYEAMGKLGWVTGTPAWMASWDLDSSDNEPATLDVYLGWGVGVPAVAQVALTHFNNSDGASAWVFQANGVDYFDQAVYLNDMKQVTFAVVSGWHLDEGFGDDWCTALLTITGFGPGTKFALETPPPPPPQYWGGDF